MSWDYFVEDKDEDEDKNEEEDEGKVDDLEEFPELPMALEHCSAVSVGKWIFVLGGKELKEYDDDAILTESINTCFVCDTESRTWHELPPELQLRRPRGEGSAVLLNDGRIVMIGGEGEHDVPEWMEEKEGYQEREGSIEFIHYIGLIPAEHRQQALRESNSQGQLPIHSAAEHGLRWEDGMKYLLEAYPESLGKKSSNGDGDLPIVLAASGSETDLSTVYEMFRGMLERNLVPIQQ